MSWVSKNGRSGIGRAGLLSGFGGQRIVQCQNDLVISLKQVPVIQKFRDRRGDMEKILISSITFIDSAWIWSCIQAVAVTVTLGLIAYQIRLQRLSDVVQSICTLQQRWNLDQMVRARRIVCRRFIEKNYVFDGVSEYVAEFFEEMGHYFNIKAVSRPALWSVFSWEVERYYMIFKEGIIENRDHFNDSTIYCEFEEMFIRMDKMSVGRGANSAGYERNSLKEFAKNEIEQSAAHFKLKWPKRRRRECGALNQFGRGGFFLGEPVKNSSEFKGARLRAKGMGRTEIWSVLLSPIYSFPGAFICGAKPPSKRWLYSDFPNYHY